MQLRVLAVSIVSVVCAFSFAVASASALTISCAGVPAAASITWSATASGGVAPIGFLWGNGATSSSQAVAETPGTYSMNIQATDASSSVATSTCSATVAVSLVPSIPSFTATPATITAGQSSVLAWTVMNASSTSPDNGLGLQTGTSVVVTPAVTTTYTLTAVNPNGTTTASATVTVNATSTSGTGSTLAQQIQALLQQIKALQQQIFALIAAQVGTTTPPNPGNSGLPPGQAGKMACITLNRNLGIGSRGKDVKSIQEMLSEDSEDGFVGVPTGFFGAQTARALARFQMRFGIASSSNGTVGPLTRGFLERHCGKGLGNGSGDNANSTNEQENGNNGSSTTTSTNAVPMMPRFRGGNGSEGNGHGNNANHGNPYDN